MRCLRGGTVWFATVAFHNCVRLVLTTSCVPFRQAPGVFTANCQEVTMSFEDQYHSASSGSSGRFSARVGVDASPGGSSSSSTIRANIARMGDNIQRMARMVCTAHRFLSARHPRCQLLW